MDTRDAAADRKKEDGRGPFEKFVEAVNGRVSRAPFFISSSASSWRGC